MQLRSTSGRLITPDLQGYMSADDVEGHVFSPNAFRDETLEWIANRNNLLGCTLPCLNDSDFRIIPGTLCVWAGTNGHGKSALVQQFGLWWAAGRNTDRKEKVLFWSPEMACKVQIERMVKQVLGVGEPTVEAASYVIDYLEDKVFIFGKEEMVNGMEIIALCRWASANEFTHIVLDSLMMVDLQTDQANLNLGTKNFIRMLKEVTRECDLNIHLVAHTKKTDNETTMANKMDVKGCTEIVDLADYAFMIHKDVQKQNKLNENPEDEAYLRKPDGFLNCLKNRYDVDHPCLPLWFSGKPFSFKKGRRTPIPRLIEPSREQLKTGYVPQ